MKFIYRAWATLVPFSLSLRGARAFFTMDGLGLHFGWRGHWEAAWVVGTGWVVDTPADFAARRAVA